MSSQESDTIRPDFNRMRPDEPFMPLFYDHGYNEDDSQVPERITRRSRALTAAAVVIGGAGMTVVN